MKKTSTVRVNGTYFFSRYRLHVWWGSYRVYFSMCVVLQGHDEFDGFVPVPDCDVQCKTFQLRLGD